MLIAFLCFHLQKLLSLGVCQCHRSYRHWILISFKWIEVGLSETENYDDRCSLSFIYRLLLLVKSSEWPTIGTHQRHESVLMVNITVGDMYNLREVVFAGLYICVFGLWIVFTWRSGQGCHSSLFWWLFWMFNFQNPFTISVLLIECDIIRLEVSIGEFFIVIHESRLLYSIISFSLAHSKVKLIRSLCWYCYRSIPATSYFSFDTKNAETNLKNSYLLCCIQA